MRTPRFAPLAAALLVASVASAQSPEWDVHYATLLKEAQHGLSSIEHAAWLVRDANGSERLVPWPASGRSRAHVWRGAVPRGTVALLHTHPADANPRPSSRDGMTARRLGMPVYTISRWGIFRADPDDAVVAVSSPLWRPTIDWAIADDLLRASRADARAAGVATVSSVRAAP